MTRNPFGARDTLDLGHGWKVGIFRLEALERSGVASGLSRLPYSVKILLEAVLRQCGTFAVTEADVTNLARWSPTQPVAAEVPFKPARVIVPDFTGATVLVDLAAMRAAVKRLGGDASRINPLVPVDLVTDHSIHADHYGTADAFAKNSEIEVRRNRERYEFLRWGQNAVRNFRVIPPGVGIVHQVNLEYLARGIMRGEDEAGPVAFPDTVLGADSHTTMINALGVLGWGVGGIEAEAAMLGQPLFMPMPKVVGVRLTGSLQRGVTATDVALTVTELLRKTGVVDKFVEFHGPGLSSLALADRATIANMAPEYGATMGFFALDDESFEYLRRTGRPEADLRLLERYAKEQGLYRTEQSPEPLFSETIALDLSTVVPSVAGPKRPQDRVPLTSVKKSFLAALAAPEKQQGFALAEQELGRKQGALSHGSVAIAAITSCTNTANPTAMIAAGLLARNAVERGLRVPSHVKTTLAPGSRVATEYLRESGLLSSLEALGFFLVGYGCTTCIGNSGPLDADVANAITEGKLVATAVLSGNRNFEGRIHPLVKANYLASPPLVVAYALAGNVDVDLTSEPLGTGKDGKPVFLEELWPRPEEVVAVTRAAITPATYESVYPSVFTGTEAWREIQAPSDDVFPWRESSTYVEEPPFFEGLTVAPPMLTDIRGARALVVLGDSITTDHIAPASNIPLDSPAGKYLTAKGVQKADFNTYGARRGSHEVSMRGMFAHIRLKNRLTPDAEGNVTAHLPSGERMTVFEASRRYAEEGTPLIVIAGKEYGTGSSRDWAAKGPRLLGVRAVIARSYERIHRSNLVGMGILPLEFLPGEGLEELGLTGEELFHIEGISKGLTPRQRVTVAAGEKRFETIARLDSPADVSYYSHGGILPFVARQMLSVQG